MKAYNVGIVGFGFIGKVHAYGYVNLPFFYDPPPLRARIAAVCTSRPETAEAGRALVGAERGVTDYRAITENPEIDIVHICSPNHLHKPALLSALAHGKHIYCDKPLVADLAEAREVQAALRGYRGTAQMTFQNRFIPPTLRACQLLAEGYVGRVLEFRASYQHSGSVPADVPLRWKLSAARGGGVIADLASHVFDLVHVLLGEFDEVMAATSIAHAERPSAEEPPVRVRVEAEDCAMLLARMRSGALGTLEATKIATGVEDEIRFEIHGTEGALRYDGTDPHHLQAYRLDAPAKPLGGMRGWTRIDTGQRYPAPAAAFPGPKFAIGWLRGHVACLAEFLASVAAGRPGDPGLDQGLYVQRLIECARRSARARRWVKMDECAIE